MEMRLVGVPALGGHSRRVVTRGQKVGRVVEPDELRGALRSETDLRSEP
jgi:hypothetical protein